MSIDFSYVVKFQEKVCTGSGGENRCGFLGAYDGRKALVQFVTGGKLFQIGEAAVEQRDQVFQVPCRITEFDMHAGERVVLEDTLGDHALFAGLVNGALPLIEWAPII